MAWSWPNTTLFRSRSSVLSLLRSSLLTARRDARDLGDDLLDLGLPMVFFCLLGQDALRGTGLVDHVDGLVGQVAVVDVLGRQLGRACRAPSAYLTCGAPRSATSGP
jgi:hypothetical protein